MAELDHHPDWPALLAARSGGAVPAGELGDLFAPILAPPRSRDGCRVIGRLAQTLDGRIATASGSSQWIGGPGDLLHTHRLRALCDAVVVGAGTVQADDPRLTTRMVEGPSPVRVVIDPDRRLSAGFKVFQDSAAETILVTSKDGPFTHGKAEVARLPRGRSGPSLSAMLDMLAVRGLTRIFVEGGGRTVSAFLLGGYLDHLHLTVAPIILGSGRPAFSLPEVPSIADGLRFDWRVWPMGKDLLCDIQLDRAAPKAMPR
jgi:diaminohydroxyphosphoribosylaminopyrimidine deaminase / 5-amino-6-(5-phosphoribosylamino)uracil reductase